MAIPIYSSDTYNFKVEVIGEVEPLSICTDVTGRSFKNGTTGTIEVFTNDPLGNTRPPTGTPYINARGLIGVLVCAGGGQTGMFNPNGWTGTAYIAMTTRDSMNAELNLNELVIQSNSLSGLLVNAGADKNSSSASTTILDATITGGVGTVSYQWSVDAIPPGALDLTIFPDTIQTFSAGGSHSVPLTITGMDVNAVYSFNLDVSDTGGHTGTDFVNVTRTGAATFFQFSEPWSFSPTGTNATTRNWSAHVVGGTPPYQYTMAEVTGDLGFSDTVTTSSTSASGSVSLIDCSTLGTVRVTVTDFNGNTVYSTTKNYTKTCWLAGSILTLSDGSKIAIEDAKAGDSLQSTNILTSDYDWRSYVNVDPEVKAETSDIVSISKSIEPGYMNINNGNYKVSLSHPFFIYDSVQQLYVFKAAGSLTNTDFLVTQKQEHVPITSVELVVQDNTEVYVIDTAPFNTYICNSVISHNKTDCNGTPLCVDPSTSILMANGITILAGDLKAGDQLFTIHETTKEWGLYEVTSAIVGNQPKIMLTLNDGTTITVSESHRFLVTDDKWEHTYNLKVGDTIKGIDLDKTIEKIENVGIGEVIKLEVNDAHTYVSNGLISHNSKTPI